MCAFEMVWSEEKGRKEKGGGEKGKEIVFCAHLLRVVLDRGAPYECVPTQE
jgi:hypothetical protein